MNPNLSSSINNTNLNMSSSSTVRNSYGYPAASTNNQQNPSSFRQFNPTKTFNKINTNIKEQLAEGKDLQLSQRTKDKNEEQKGNSNLGRSTKYTPPTDFKPISNLGSSKMLGNSFLNNKEVGSDEKGPQLRGSCPNIFKKFQQSNYNPRNTTQFGNLSGKFSTEQTEEETKGASSIVRNMKKTSQTAYLEESGPSTPDPNTDVPTDAFNPNKSMSSGQLPSFRHNFNKTLVNTAKKEPFGQKSTHMPSTNLPSASMIQSPIKTKLNLTPNKLTKKQDSEEEPRTPTKIYQKKSPCNEVSCPSLKKTAPSSSQKTSAELSNKTSKTSNTSQQEPKKFKSLHQIWQIKQKQKTDKRIAQDTKNNQLSRSPVINGFEIGKVLGKGKFGEVFLARHRQTGFIAAIKKIVKSKVKEYKMVEQFGKEIRLQNSLDHPNIVKFFGAFEDETQPNSDEVFLVLQYMNGGTLFDYLNEVYHLSVKQTIEFLRDIIEAIIYLHERSIAHRDIKPENIVISTEGVAKLCDFGWSAIVETSRKTYCGTFDYAPPQILQRKSYDMSVDVWCIGVLTYELLTGRVPFEGNQRNEIAQKIVNVDKVKIEYPADMPSQAIDFIELLMQKDPAKRPKPTELLKHPFFELCPPKVKSKKFQ